MMYLNKLSLATILEKKKIHDVFHGHACMSSHVKNQNHFAKIKDNKILFHRSTVL